MNVSDSLKNLFFNFQYRDEKDKRTLEKVNLIIEEAFRQSPKKSDEELVSKVLRRVAKDPALQEAFGELLVYQLVATEKLEVLRENTSKN